MTRRHAFLMIAATALMSTANHAWSASPWAIACGDGRVDQILDNFDATWDTCCTAHASIPMPTQRTVAGCSGNALALSYDLRNVAPVGGASWVVVQRSFAAAKDLRGYTHVRLALKGSNVDNHDNVEVKLKAANGLFTARLVSVTDLPEWRALYIDLREFTGNGAPDLSSVSGLELALVRAEDNEVWNIPGVGGKADPHAATMYFDEFAVVNLRPGGPRREAQATFEPVAPVPAIRQAAARALLERVVPSGPGAGLVPAWFTEPTPNFNIYAQAEALLVFLHEHSLTGDATYRDAAQRLGARLIALQIAPDAAQSGAWFTAHSPQSGVLAPPQRTTQAVPCNGNERDIRDVDACQWIGNTGWALIALSRLRHSGLYENDPALAAAIERGASWIVAQIGRTGGYDDITSLGIEGNVSAYFGLLAAGRASDAERLGRGIFARGWDPIQHRMKTGARAEDAATALDVAGSWGVTFLRAVGRNAEALESAGFTYSTMRVNSFDGTRRGFGDIAGPFTPAVEFIGQAAAAGIRDANLVMQEVAAMQIPAGRAYAGAFPGAADAWYGGSLPPWNTTMPGVSPTAWVHFAHSGDPLLALLQPRVGVSLNQRRFQPGDVLTLNARLLPGTAETTVDVYLALQLPGCTTSACALFWQPNNSFTPSPLPVLKSWVVERYEAPVFTYRFTGSEPPGRYTWLAAFVKPGTGEVIGSISQPSFEFGR